MLKKNPFGDRIIEEIQEHLDFLYEPEKGSRCFSELLSLLGDWSPDQLPAVRRFDQSDSILITYGDQVQEPGLPPLQSLTQFLLGRLKGIVPAVHLLPFFPYSSDDGFSVIDYSRVDPALGDWDDIARLGDAFDLMFDAVINHISAGSTWFQRFLRDDPVYTDYFITVEPGTDLSQVTRPRALPLLSPFRTPSGEKLVWTTFSADQIDLNYANPRVLLEVIKVLLDYVAKGASLIRLDAIAYLWKTIGTTCIHLEQTHRVVQLFRAVLDAVAPGVKLITETNVPHAENISYFGDGSNEAQMVYQFPLAPLILNAIQTGRSTHLSRWAAGLELPSDRVTFFNFTASHDGIGLMPAQGILSELEIRALVDQTLAHGGKVSYKANADGGQSVYELNISYFDALSDPGSDEPLETQIRRFIASQAIMLALQGVSGIYFHSLFGSRSWPAGVAETGRHRTINRQKLQRRELESELSDPDSIRHQVFKAYSHLLRQRASHPAFHPHGRQEVHFDDEALFVLLRTSPGGEEQILCIQNITNQEQRYRLPASIASRDTPCGQDLTGLQPESPSSRQVFRKHIRSFHLIDLVSGERYNAKDEPILTLQPYQTLWLALHT
jgi:sucrose phosphorylase